jgi:hypothetical protein
MKGNESNAWKRDMAKEMKGLEVIIIESAIEEKPTEQNPGQNKNLSNELDNEENNQTEEAVTVDENGMAIKTSEKPKTPRAYNKKQPISPRQVNRNYLLKMEWF